MRELRRRFYPGRIRRAVAGSPGEPAFGGGGRSRERDEPRMGPALPRAVALALALLALAGLAGRHARRRQDDLHLRRRATASTHFTNPPQDDARYGPC